MQNSGIFLLGIVLHKYIVIFYYHCRAPKMIATVQQNQVTLKPVALNRHNDLLRPCGTHDVPTVRLKNRRCEWDCQNIIEEIVLEQRVCKIMFSILFIGCFHVKLLSRISSPTSAVLGPSTCHYYPISPLFRFSLALLLTFPTLALVRSFLKDHIPKQV